MDKKGFDYYIFVDYSENLIGYLIIELCNIKGILPKISRFRHYNDAINKRLYIRNVKITFKKDNLLNYFLRAKIREVMQTPEIFSDIAEFLKCNSNCRIFISIDNRQYSNFERFVKIIDCLNTKIVKESELKKDSSEYKISLVLDTWLNIGRLNNEK